MTSASVAGLGMGRRPLVTLVKPSSSTWLHDPPAVLPRLRPKMGILPPSSMFLMAPGFLCGQFADVWPVSLQPQQRL